MGERECGAFVIRDMLIMAFSAFAWANQQPMSLGPVIGIPALLTGGDP